MRRGRSLSKLAVAAQVAALAAALAGPPAVAAATVAFSLDAPSVSTVQYSDMVTFHVTYTCVSDDSPCLTTLQTFTATFLLRPSGASTFSTITTISNSFAFTSDPTTCKATAPCSKTFPFTWRSGRIGNVTVPPGVYDIGLTSSMGPGQHVLPAALTITPEATSTTYTGVPSGMGNTALALSGTVVDQDRGLTGGTGIIFPDTNLTGTGVVTFRLYDATNTTPVEGVASVSANVTQSGVISIPSGTAPLVLPAAGGTFILRTTYAGNTFYLGSSDADTITVSPSNTPPVLTVPTGPIVVEAGPNGDRAVEFSVTATDAEDDPDPVPTCSPSSGSVFAVGSTTVSCFVQDHDKATDTETFVVTVLAATDPFVGIDTPEDPGATGWFNIASNDGTPGVTVDVTADDDSGVANLTCTDNGASIGLADPLGGSFVVSDGTHAVECTATDGAGNVATKAALYRVDQTAPDVSASVGPAPATSGWWNLATGAPTATFTCSDATSGVASCSQPFTFGEGADLATSGTATDVAGNAATASVTGLDVDLTAPSISSSIGPARAASGWWNAATGAPTATFSCSDATSGTGSCSQPFTFGEGADLSTTGTATDVAGNSAAASVTGIDVDLTGPSGITFTGGGLVDGGEYAYLFVPTGPTGCGATDALSGFAGCTVTGYADSIGSHSIVGTARDVAGNPATGSLGYLVSAWTLSGFSKPIDMTGMNALRAGGTAQLKFEVFAGAAQLTAIDIVSSVETAQLTCAVESKKGGGSGGPSRPGGGAATFTVESAGNGRFTVKWTSPDVPESCWQVTVRTIDGSSLSATFKLR